MTSADKKQLEFLRFLNRVKAEQAYMDTFVPRVRECTSCDPFPDWMDPKALLPLIDLPADIREIPYADMFIAAEITRMYAIQLKNTPPTQTM